MSNFELFLTLRFSGISETGLDAYIKEEDADIATERAEQDVRLTREMIVSSEETGPSGAAVLTDEDDWTLGRTDGAELTANPCRQVSEVTGTCGDDSLRLEDDLSEGRLEVDESAEEH